MLAIFRGVTLTLLVFTVLLFLVTRLEAIPRSTLVLQYFLLFGLLAGPRVLYRSWKDGSLLEGFERFDPNRIPVLLAGSGAAAAVFIREMEDRKSTRLNSSH